MLPPSRIYKQCYYGPLLTFVFPVFISPQIWCKFVKNVFLRRRPPPSWIFEKCYFGPQHGLYLPAYKIWFILITNWPIYTLLCILQKGGRRHLDLPKRDILDRWWHLYRPYLYAYQIWCKSIKNWLKYTSLFQDGGRRHLEFPKSAIFDADDT